MTRKYTGKYRTGKTQRSDARAAAAAKAFNALPLELRQLDMQIQQGYATLCVMAYNPDHDRAEYQRIRLHTEQLERDFAAGKAAHYATQE